MPYEFQSREPVRKIVCRGCVRETDVVLGLSSLEEGHCARCPRLRKGTLSVVVQEPMPPPKTKAAPAEE